MIVLGRIVGAYGIRGWVWLHPFADDPDRWLALKTWSLSANDAAAADTWVAHAIEGIRADAGKIAVKLAGVDDRSSAELIKGCYVGVSREQMPAPADGEYYWDDLVGMQVQSLSGDVLGEVTELISSSANDVLVVSGEPQMLIPFVGAIIQRVDTEQRVIHADWQMGW